MTKSNQETKTFKAGETIYSHNDPAEYIFLIHSGKVRIESKHGLELGILDTGEIFGEVGHIIESPRTVTAVAVTNSIIRVIDEKTVKEKMKIGKFYYNKISNKDIYIQPPEISYSKNIYWVIGVLIRNKKITASKVIKKLKLKRQS